MTSATFLLTFVHNLTLMGGLVEGAALGTAFDLLYKSPRQPFFSEDFNLLKSTLCLIKLIIDEFGGFNQILNRAQQETQIFANWLQGSDEFLQKCAKVKRWNVFKRFYYSIKLSRLESSLVSFLQLDVAALHLHESKRISVVVSNLEDKINELTSILDRSQIVRCSSNSFSKIVAGFEDGENAGCGEIMVMDQ